MLGRILETSDSKHVGKVLIKEYHERQRWHQPLKGSCDLASAVPASPRFFAELVLSPPIAERPKEA